MMNVGSKLQLAVKRALDLVVSLIGLISMAVPFALIALAIKVDSKGSIFFRQEREGRTGSPFTILKFRTMSNVVDGDGNLLPDEMRLTRVGRNLRRTGLDELPELWNVLWGAMSLVGPRPWLLRYTHCYSERERKRFQVRPGITGLALVNGRNNLTWDRRLAYDVWYAENWSLWLDIRILFRTVFQVALQRNVRVLPTLSMRALDEERRSDDE
jgi:sugar transferase EpsL